MFIHSAVKMTSKELYSNSNEICDLVESTSGWSVTPLERLDDAEEPTTLFLFDLLFYQLPERDGRYASSLKNAPSGNS